MTTYQSSPSLIFPAGLWFFAFAFLLSSWASERVSWGSGHEMLFVGLHAKEQGISLAPRQSGSIFLSCCLRPHNHRLYYRAFPPIFPKGLSVASRKIGVFSFSRNQHQSHPSPPQPQYNFYYLQNCSTLITVFCWIHSFNQLNRATICQPVLGLVVEFATTSVIPCTTSHPSEQPASHHLYLYLHLR